MYGTHRRYAQNEAADSKPDIGAGQTVAIGIDSLYWSLRSRTTSTQSVTRCCRSELKRRGKCNKER